MSTSIPASFNIQRNASSLMIRVAGSWTREHIQTLALPENILSLDPAIHRVIIDGTGLEKLDTAGVLRLHVLVDQLTAAGREVRVIDLKPAFETLFNAIPAQAAALSASPKAAKDPLAWVVEVGRVTEDKFVQAKTLLAFFGLIMETAARLWVKPARFRFTSLIYHLQKTGLDALPILGLLSLLIGVVLAYQGADQLRAFGADLYVVNLLGISILREIGVLLTAIIVAGRSGSAFTAQIGTMKVNQEIDAMQTFGLDPVELLVLPRILALVIVLPLLVFFSDMAALLGGAMMSYSALGITFSAFFVQLKAAITLKTLWVGLIKAPVFAFVIGLVGCYQGLQVSGSAESVGTRTTQSVVQAIFLVIILDALFSIAFSIMKI